MIMKTGAGKTYTMLGPGSERSLFKGAGGGDGGGGTSELLGSGTHADAHAWGIIPRAVAEIFERCGSRYVFFLLKMIYFRG